MFCLKLQLMNCTCFFRFLNEVNVPICFYNIIYYKGIHYNELLIIINVFFFDFIDFKSKYAPNRINVSSNPDTFISNSDLIKMYATFVRNYIFHTNIVLLSYDVFILTET